MSNKIMTVVGAFALGLGILASTTQGCGGGSSGPSPADIAAICNQSCMTAVKCAGGFITMDQCVQQCTACAKTQSGAMCANAPPACK